MPTTHTHSSPLGELIAQDGEAPAPLDDYEPSGALYGVPFFVIGNYMHVLPAADEPAPTS